MSYLKEYRDDLVKFTKGCREDMHEPDEQNVSARVVGTSLDNAMGETIDPKAIEDGYQEIVVILERLQDKKPALKLRINLATLIALARKAKL